jgi:N-acetylglutamate synthase/N-acetylornithine aminotransferase
MVTAYRAPGQEGAAVSMRQPSVPAGRSSENDAGFDEAAAKRELDEKELTIRVELHHGKGCARLWTCDFTREYIDINASYRT